MRVQRNLTKKRKQMSLARWRVSLARDANRGSLERGQCHECQTGSRARARPSCLHVQGWAKEWSLGCVNSRPAARGSQEAGFTQPRNHLIAHICKVERCHESTLPADINPAGLGSNVSGPCAEKLTFCDIHIFFVFRELFSNIKCWTFHPNLGL